MTLRAFLVLALVALLTLGSACGGRQSSLPRCPDSPHVPCMTQEECSVDAARDCEMCRCAPPADVPLEQNDPLPPGPPE